MYAESAAFHLLKMSQLRVYPVYIHCAIRSMVYRPKQAAFQGVNINHCIAVKVSFDALSILICRLHAEDIADDRTLPRSDPRATDL